MHMLWACILLPQLALDSILRERDDADTPLVLIGGPVQRACCKPSTPPRRRLACGRGRR
jgi:hypothetical protein